MSTPMSRSNSPHIRTWDSKSISYIVKWYIPHVLVRSATLATSPPSFTSFGMKLSERKPIVGCLRSSKSRKAHSPSPSTNSGRHAGSPIASELLAKLKRQSSSASVLTARNQTSRSLSNSAKTRSLKFLMAAFRVSRASFRSRIFLERSGTVHRATAWKHE